MTNLQCVPVDHALKNVPLNPMPQMLKRTVTREDKGISVIIQLFLIQSHVREWRNVFVWHLPIYFLE